ncbi:MAG: alpha/beta fold hydrolase [Ghiorsea sp.]
MSSTQVPHFIFLHGWGQSAQIWHQQMHNYTCFEDASFINLPGHGGANESHQGDWLSHLTEQIQHDIDDHNQPSILIGWSLGGQIALAIETQLSDLKGLVLISTTPSFRQSCNWSPGCSDEIWQSFSQAALSSTPKIMQRFFQMMMIGDNLSRTELQHMAKESINKETPPTPQALQTGLTLLSSIDLRSNLKKISLPTLIINGAQDVIVPLAAGQYLADHVPNAKIHVFQDCGHAPFLSHHVAFNQVLELWWKNLSMLTR